MRFVVLTVALAASACKTLAPPDAALKDTSIVSGAPRDQGGTAFCWSYALVGHIEQRFYELTRGPSAGGFRLNLSEEYLGLVHLTNQLVQGKPLDEGLVLSGTLALLDRYGIVPEKIGGKELFKAHFDHAVSVDVMDRAAVEWSERNEAENAPLPLDVAVKVVAEGLSLTEEQHAFLAAAMGATDASGSHFRFANTDYTPVTFMKERLKFSAADYHVIAFPETGRGAGQNGPYSPAYAQDLNVLKKALLYGYSIPISINFVDGSRFEDGAITCKTPGCPDAMISTPTASWPHANHAVLIVDYRTATTTFTPPTAETIERSYASDPSEWVIKNSWGFNNNTSQDPSLLKRFPLPAYTVMAQDFFEASHRLRPLRFEAIVPRKVCLRELTKERRPVCEDLITASGPNLKLDVPLLLGNVNRAAMARDPVEIDPSAPSLDDGDALMKILKGRKPQGSDLPFFSLARETLIENLQRDQFHLCTQVEVDPKVKYVAIYVTAEDGTPKEAIPRAVLSEQSKWRLCQKVDSAPKRFGLTLQALDARFGALGQLKTKVVVAGE